MNKYNIRMRYKIPIVITVSVIGIIFLLFFVLSIYIETRKRTRTAKEYGNRRDSVSERVSIQY